MTATARACHSASRLRKDPRVHCLEINSSSRFGETGTSSYVLVSGKVGQNDCLMCQNGPVILEKHIAMGYVENA